MSPIFHAKPTDDNGQLNSVVVSREIQLAMHQSQCSAQGAERRTDQLLLSRRRAQSIEMASGRGA